MSMQDVLDEICINIYELKRLVEMLHPQARVEKIYVTVAAKERMEQLVAQRNRHWLYGNELAVPSEKLSVCGIGIESCETQHEVEP